MRNNKYFWLAMISITSFLFLCLLNYKNEKKKALFYPKNYPLQVIDNEIKLGDEVLYRFIPVDGGTMEFKYLSKEPHKNGTNGIEDTLEIYTSKRLYIPSFLIGETPVEQKLFAFVMGYGTERKDEYKDLTRNIYYKYPNKEEWDKFIEKLNELTGCEFCLPTNYQWEYAARGGIKSKNYKYAGSNNIKDVAKYKENTKADVHVYGKQKLPNELGLYDMSGGVNEITSTPLSELYPYLLLFNDESLAGFKNACIERGGSSSSSAKECEVDYVSCSYSTSTGARLIMKY